METPEIMIDPADFTLLIVDDKRNNLDVITNYLSGVGFKTLIARSGEVAIKRAKRAKPDMILLDIQMPPGIDGFETCLRLKADEETVAIPVIFMTALNETKDKVRGFEVGAVDYVTKPIQHEELYSRVITHLKNHTLTHHLSKLVAEQTAELSQAKETAEIANHAKSKFLNQVSHELRTPLTSILLYTSLLQRRHEAVDDDKTSRHLSIIEENGEHLKLLIERLLDFGRLGVQELELNVEDVSLHAMLEHVQTNITSQINDRPVEFVLTVAHDSPTTICTDNKRLEYVITELLENAIKATDEGSVTLNISYLAAAQKLRVEVIDTGVGIAESDQQRIFYPFEQIGSTTKLADGVGLGLTTSQQIVQALGGRINVESTIGTGSRFWFETPRQHIRDGDYIS